MSFSESAKVDVSVKKVATHPKVSEMVNAAIMNLAERQGSSLRAINKYIIANYGIDIAKISTHIKKYLKAAVESGDLVQPKAVGMTGSFKINKNKGESKSRPPKAKSTMSLKMQTSTPKKGMKPKKAVPKSPNKSPVKKPVVDAQAPNAAIPVKTKAKRPKKLKVSLPTKPRKSMVSPTDATFVNPKAKKPKSKVSLPTKPRKSLVALSTKIKKHKKSVSKMSPGEKSNPTKLPKNEGATKSSKPKKSPKSTKSAVKREAVKKTKAEQN